MASCHSDWPAGCVHTAEGAFLHLPRPALALLSLPQIVAFIHRWDLSLVSQLHISRVNMKADPASGVAPLVMHWAVRA